MEGIGRKFSAPSQGFCVLCMNFTLHGSNILISAQSFKNELKKQS